MPDLPFLTGPLPTRAVEAVVNGQATSIELPVHGAILGGEALHAESHRYQNAFNAEAGALADALLGDGFTPDDAEAAAARILSVRCLGVPALLTDAEHRAMLTHIERISESAGRLQQEFAEQQIRKATAVIRYRVAGQLQWGDDDTMARIPQPMIDALSRFFDQEQLGDAPQRTADEIVAEMVDTLGKLAPEPEPETPPDSTSPNSSGEAVPSGPTIPPSPANDSPTPRSRTSSKRSAGAKSTS